MVFEVAVILLLTMANGLFSGVEIAVLSVRKTRLRELMEAGNKGASAVHNLRGNTEHFLATVQIGITVVGATAAAFGGASIATRLEAFLRGVGLTRSAPEIALGLVVALVSYLSIVLGELVPKSIGLRYSERYALLMARPMQALSWLIQPLVWLLTASSNLVLKLFGDHTTFTESRLSPDELQQLVEEASKSGSVHPRTGEIASRAFDLANLTVAEAMVPRSQVVSLKRHATAQEVQRILLEEGHQRMPVYEGTPDNIVGYVVAKDLLAFVLERELFVLEDAVRPAYFVPLTTRALDVLQGMQQRQILLAVVVDETGGLAGIVTMEDLIEELVGEIFNEHETPPEMFRREPDGGVVIQAGVPVREVNRELDVQLPETGGYTTLGGLCTSLARSIPPAGTTLTLDDGTTLEVLESSPRRVKQVRLRKARRSDER